MFNDPLTISRMGCTTQSIWSTEIVRVCSSSLATSLAAYWQRIREPGHWRSQLREPWPGNHEAPVRLNYGGALYHEDPCGRLGIIRHY